MTRLGMVAAAAATLAAVVLAPAVGHAQSVDAAAQDLRTHDVTFENGAVTDPDLADLDRVAAQLQADGGYTKVVVLTHPVDTSASARAFAGKVRDTLGGRGRVIVFDPQDVGIATNVPGEASKVNSAELAAIDAANRSNSFATGVLAAADTLGVKGSAGSGSGTDGSGGQDLGASGGSTGSILPLVLLVALVGVVGVGFYLWWSSRKRKAAAAASSVSQAEGEQQVRSEVEVASNLVIDLADRTEAPGAPAEAVTAFRDGATEFAALQDDLEAADTREELESVYPRLVHARWKLECSKAILDEQPAPAEPTPGLLFPPPPPPPQGAAPAPSAPSAPSAPEPHYQKHTQHSPWLTDAAITAITVLASRGLASARSSPRRQPSDDVWFQDRYGGSGGSSRSGGSRGGGRQSGTQSRPPISMGGQRGRGMGDR